MGRKMTFWYMQVHPSSQAREYNADVMTASVLETLDVGLGNESQWPEGNATRERFRNDVKIGDVAVIAHGRKLMLLVRFTGEFCESQPAETGGHWYGCKRDVAILDVNPGYYARLFAQKYHQAAVEGLPIRLTLSKIKKNKFAEFWYDAVEKNLPARESLTSTIPPSRFSSLRSAWRRDSAVVERVRQRGVCELCGKRQTFEKASGGQYFEAHHLIPIASQGLFGVGLDVLANTICLCPECHRFLHYGRSNERCEALKKIYTSRADSLKAVQLVTTQAQFLRYTLDLL